MSGESDPPTATIPLEGWEQIRRKTAQLETLAQQLVVVIGQLAEAIESADTGGAGT